ncbi:MAG: hypothetical protein EOP84_20710 [Verrucomicrobiaceae bacterium]|nr:MAG: hypothetical protein EOP84_20710 [Verrucomicrobiaceae bacterium]
MAAFASLFSRPVWKHAQALLSGALVAPKANTITAALRALGLSADKHFTNYHRVLNRASWNAHKAAAILLGLLMDQFVARTETLTFGLDELIERRRGRRITARAIYRDPVHSSHECFQKTSGLRWMSVHLLAYVPWAKRVWALPFLSALCPSERYAPFQQHGRAHKPPVRRARALIGQISRWMPERPLIVVADGGYSALELLAWCVRLSARRVARCATATLTLITRLRLDAALYDPAPQREPETKGRPRRKGKRQPTLKARLEDKETQWFTATLPWYGAVGSQRTVEYATGTAVWYHSGMVPVAIRWVLIRDPEGRFESQALLSTNQDLSVEEILRAFVKRWQMEVTFEETHAHLGLDGQRQWSDTAIERTTPIRLALFSLVALIASHLPLSPDRKSAWYSKAHVTFSDALAAVRRCLLENLSFSMSASKGDTQKTPLDLTTHLINLLCYST